MTTHPRDTDRATIAAAQRHYCTNASFRADVERIVHATLLTHDDMHTAANDVRRHTIVTTYLALSTSRCSLATPRREQDR